MPLFGKPAHGPDRGGATLSECGLYRYKLWRQWNSALPRMVFIMLNPSTADATENDPTIRRCIGFAKRERHGGILVLNLFAWRATDPKELLRVEDPVGPDNRGVWFESMGLAQESPPVVAWGALHKSLKWREDEAWRVLIRPVCLGTTKAGHPRHPLYLSKSTPLNPWGPQE